MTIDPGYTVGFTFARQYGIRLTKDFSRKVWFAVAMENPQGTLTTHDNADNFVLGSEGATSSYNDAVSACTIGNFTATGATTPTYYTTCSPIGTYTFNPSPDVIAKIAFDPGLRTLRDLRSLRSLPRPHIPLRQTSLANNRLFARDPAKTGSKSLWERSMSRKTAAALAPMHAGISTRSALSLACMSSVAKELAATARPSFRTCPFTATERPNVIKNGQGLATLEWHGKKLDVYSYAGAEYDGRTTDFDPTNRETSRLWSPQLQEPGLLYRDRPSIALTNGFIPGALANCTADTRAAILEGTFGFWYRFYSGPRGRFQFGTQYSYVTRKTWSGARLLEREQCVAGQESTTWFLPRSATTCPKWWVVPVCA